MAKNYNLTNQSISSSFDQLLQKNDTTGKLVDGTGSVVEGLIIDGTVSGSFFVGDGSGLTNISASAVLPAGVVSGSSQIILQDTTGDLSGSRIDGTVTSASYAVTASYALNVTPHVDTGSLLQTASITDATITFTKGDSSTFDITVDNIQNAIYSQNTIITGKNLHTLTIDKGTPLYFTASGTSGNIVGIYPADAGNPDRMPAGGIAGENIVVGAEGVVLLDGFIGGVDTSTFGSGDEIFVAVGGGYTNIAPTGSSNLIQHLGNVEKSAVNGSGVIQMMGEARGLPNITTGHAWVGDGNGVPQEIPTSSFGGGGTIDTGSFVTTSSFNAYTSSTDGRLDSIESKTGSYATTGSNQFIGDQGITGSVHILEVSGSSDYPFKISSPYIPGDGIQMGFFKGPISQTEVAFLSSNARFQSTGDLYFDTKLTGGSNTLTFSSENTIFTSSVVQVTSSIDVRDTAKASIFLNPIDLTGSLVVTSGSNGMVVGPVNNLGTITVESGSTLLVLSEATGSGGGTTDITALNNFTASQEVLNTTFATTGSNSFVGTQYITGSLFVSSSSDTLIRGNRVKLNSEVGDPNIQVGWKSGSGVFGLQQNITNVDSELVINNQIRFDEARFNPGEGTRGTYATFAKDLPDDLRLNIHWSGTPASGSTWKVQLSTGSNDTQQYFESFWNGNQAKIQTYANNSISEIQITADTSKFSSLVNLAPQDPLPAGTVGDMAVSGSNLYFYDGSWRQVSLV